MKRPLAFVVGSTAIAMGAAFACTDPGPISTTVIVEKLVPSSSGDPCYVACDGSAVPSSSLVLPKECSEAVAAGIGSVSCGFGAGVDTMRVIVDYGSVDIDTPLGFVGPQLQVTSDGIQGAKQTMAPGPVRSGTHSLYATIELPASAKPVEDLRFQVALAGGGIVEPTGSYSVDPLTAALTLERLTSDSSGPCFAACQGSASPRSVLDLVGMSCIGMPPVNCGFTAGADKMRIVADYGDVAVTSGAGFAGATLSIMGDGAQLFQGALPLAPFGNGGFPQHAFAEVEITVPNQTVSVLGVQATLAGGTNVSVPGTYTVTTSNVDVSIAQCAAGSACTAIGGTGSVAATVTLPGTQRVNVIVTTSIDGVPQPVVQTIPADTPTTLGSTPAVTGTAFIPVPSAHEGAHWLLQAQAGLSTGNSPMITIHTPSITAAFTCGSLCNISAGSIVGLLVTAPIDSAVTQATVNTLVKGAPSLVGATVALTTADVNAKTISGVLQLPVPNAVGSSWEIDTTVGGYAAQSIVVPVTM